MFIGICISFLNMNIIVPFRRDKREAESYLVKYKKKSRWYKDYSKQNWLTFIKVKLKMIIFKKNELIIILKKSSSCKILKFFVMQGFDRTSAGERRRRGCRHSCGRHGEICPAQRGPRWTSGGDAVAGSTWTFQGKC